ncbi:gamma-aminobutyric acid receptor-associated protein-like 2 isoform X1 [Microcebus murinus]|uniref:gamma-aminobutyric acid receptor-associated protein-like 2 isoform X1 n=1 Tax=Microcebus murinus TaxID=30608 RepID=UPI003F6B443B
MKWMFKEDHSLEHRCVESSKIRAKYPDRVPVIVEKVSGSQIVDIDKRKYLVPSDITVAQFMWIIRKRIQLPSEKAIFLFVDKTVPQSRSRDFDPPSAGASIRMCNNLFLLAPPDNLLATEKDISCSTVPSCYLLIQVPHSWFFPACFPLPIKEYSLLPAL